MKYWILTLLSVALLSCKKDKEPATQTPATTQKTVKKTVGKLALESFGFPEEVEGCSCYFAENRQEFIKQNYIYVDDYQKNAFIKINSELIKIPFEKSKDNSPGKQLNISIKNDDYSVELKAERIQEGEMETQLYKGNITVTNLSTKDKIQLPIYGECGC